MDEMDNKLEGTYSILYYQAGIQQALMLKSQGVFVGALSEEW
jgi:hypothetical protein